MLFRIVPLVCMRLGSLSFRFSYFILLFVSVFIMLDAMRLIIAASTNISSTETIFAPTSTTGTTLPIGRCRTPEIHSATVYVIFKGTTSGSIVSRGTSYFDYGSQDSRNEKEQYR